MRLIAPALLALALITGCASGPPPMQAKPPALTASRHALAPEPGIEKTYSHVLKPLDDKGGILYVQNYGGGGVGLGLLLGPLGVAANIAAIEKNTNDDLAVLKGKFSLDPIALTQAAVAERPEFAPNAGTQAATRLSPVVQIVRDEAGRLLVGCILNVAGTSTERAWRGRYVYQTSVVLDKADVARSGLSDSQRRQLDQAVAEGFKALVQLYADDSMGKLEGGKEVAFTSEYVTPRFSFELRGQSLAAPADRLQVRSFNAVYSLPRAMVKLSS
jgi:hypothetical protein